MFVILLLSSALAHPQCAGPQDVGIQTEDGAEAWLHRHPADGPAVLVVHGVSSNHWCWDLDPDRSLATTLNAQGFDIWFIDLGGHGCAERKQDGSRQAPRRSFDDYGSEDVASAIAHIQEVTSTDQVAYIGHSMGGHVAAAYVATHGDSALSALVVLGSPIDFENLETRFRLSRAGALFGSALPALPSPWAARMAAHLQALPFGMDHLFYAEGSISPETRAAMYRTVVSPLSRGELTHYRRVLRAGHLISSDGEIDYREVLGSLDIPLLVIAGAGDMVAPPDRVRAYYDHAGSTDKTFLIAGRQTGFSFDYGHLDLTLGDLAPEEIHSPIGAWLLSRTGAVD
jgi:pimeloyl-ACP methyl ester carboxylesterase